LGFGLIARYSSNIEITTNHIFDNSEYGVYIEESTGLTAYHNSFLCNGIHAYDTGSDSVWYKPYSQGGNYWDDWTGPDSYNGATVPQTIGSPDMIVDFPRLVNGGLNQDNYPLTNQVDDGRISHPPIRINADSGFLTCTAVSSGTGTSTDPYVIENFKGLIHNSG